MDTLHEHVEDLTCPSGHVIEVHWTEGEQASHWQCPICLADPGTLDEKSIVAFESRV